MHIGGRQVLASAGEFELRSPLDSSILLGYFQKGSAEFARKALEAANQNFESWSGRPWTERVALVRKAAEIIEKRQFYLAALITYEGGKNSYEAIAEVNEAADMLRYYARVMEPNLRVTRWWLGLRLLVLRMLECSSTGILSPSSRIRSRSLRRWEARTRLS